MPASAPVRHAALTGVIIAVAAGCGVAEPSPVVFRDSAGVTIAENKAVAADRIPSWVVDSEPRLRIGRSDGPAAYQLHRVVVGGVVRLSNGRIAVLDNGSKELRLFGRDGAHIRSVGGEGDGPGEFRGPYGLLRLAGDTLAAFDDGHHYFTLFTPDGEFLRVVRLNRSFTNPEIVGVFGDGSIAMSDMRLDVPESGSMVAPGVLTSYSRDGAFIDSLGTVRWLELGTIDRGQMSMAAPIFAPRTSTALHGDRLWVGTAVEPSIEVRDQRGKLVRLVRWVSEDRTVGPNDALTWFEQSRPNATPERRQRFLATKVMDRYPPYSGLIADADGNLWVEPYARPGKANEPWLVFDGDGALIAQVEMPDRLTVTEIGSDWVLGVLRDEMDVEQVVLYGLRR